MIRKIARVLRGVFIGLSVIGVLLGSLYVALPWLAHKLVENALVEQQVELLDMHFNRPSWVDFTSKTFQLNVLTFTLEDDTEIKINNVRVVLNNAGTGVNLLHIASINVLRQNATSTDDKPLAEIDLFDLLPSALFDELPDTHLAIDSLVIDTPEIKLSGLTADFSSTGLAARARLKTDLIKAILPVKHADVSLNISTANDMDFILSKINSKPFLELALALRKRDNFLEGKLQLASSLAQFSLELADGALLTVNDNQFASTAEFSLPAKQVLALDKITRFTALSKVLDTAVVSDGGSRKATQLRVNATIEHSLNKGVMGLSLVVNDEVLVQAEGELSRVVFQHENNEIMGAIFAKITDPIVIEYDLQDDLGEGLMISAGDFAFEYVEKGSRLVDVQLSDMTFNMSDNEGGVNSSFRLKGGMDLAAKGPLKFKNLSIGSLNALINSDIAIDSDLLTIKPFSNNVLSMHSVHFNEHTAKAVSLIIPKQGFNVNLKTGDVSTFKFSLNGTDFVSNDAEMKLLDFQFKGDVKNNKVNLHLTTNAMDAVVSGDSYYIPPMGIKSKLSLEYLNVNQANIKVVNICNDPLLTASWSSIQQTGHLIDVRWDHVFSSDKTLRQWLNTSILPFDLSGGTFTGQITVELGEAAVQFRQLDVSLNNGQGIYEEGTFEGVQFQLSSPLRELKSGKTKPAVTFDTFYVNIDGTVEALNMGIKADNVVLKSALYDAGNDWHFKIPLLKANVFSGVVEIREQDINLSKDVQLDLIVKQLDLSELVGTQEMDGLHTTGKLSGHIPLLYSNGQINVLNGEINSIQRGKIRYTTPLSKSDDINEQLKLTLDVLEDFNYTTLNSKIVYDDDTLYLKSTIAGNNPNVANGRPINLNLNTEVGLKGAIEAMRIQSGINSRIEDFVGSKITTSTDQYYCQ